MVFIYLFLQIKLEKLFYHKNLYWTLWFNITKMWKMFKGGI